MPELPEVEIVKQSLKKKIKYKKIKKVIVSNRNLRFKVHQNFEKILKNRFIKQVLRKSKYLIFELDDSKYCIIHLGMSGTIHLVKKYKKNKYTNLSFYQSPILPNKHNHVEIQFENFKIIYNDPRRFGFFKLLNNKKELKKYFKRFGPEANSAKFNFNYVNKGLVNKKKNIKNLLLDQSFVSGIGNIYANEILFRSKINPLKLAKKLSSKEIDKLIKYSKLILNLSIKFGGSSIRDFKNAKGNSGLFQNNFKVYNRENKNCVRKNCKGKIIKIFITNRSSFICKFCQK